MSHTNSSGHQCVLCCPGARWTGSCPSPLKPRNFFKFPFLVAWLGEHTRQLSTVVCNCPLTMPAICCRHAPAWNTQEVLDLLGLWEEEAVQAQLQSSHRNVDLCEQMAQGMWEKGYKRDWQQCCVKAKELQHGYQKAKEASNPSSAELQTCHFYRELHANLREDPTTTCKSPMDTSEEPQALTMNSKEEGVDKEEVKEYGGQVTRGSSCAVSKDLFDSSALLPVPTAAADAIVAWRVSLFTPAKLLSQMSGRKITCSRRSCKPVLQQRMRPGPGGSPLQPAWRRRGECTRT
ncbi:uncharacterized protein LOC127057035 isoform X2 [Gopherus flavomarginatus]|uniref:uncharacterized protein LOC127057035 isoform X2 n=1 Tax=Gopherus flavomarginatus TaxID=286002 RepID=UPI0021CBEE30|nr:uncharacterized protein LOC127057035 isoform X2 [Gopherus flavomarginatus]